MNRLKLSLTIALAFSFGTGMATADNDVLLTSPDKDLSVRLNGNNLNISYEAQDRPLPLFTVAAPGVTVNNTFEAVKEWTVVSTSPVQTTEYDMVGGKSHHCSNRYREYTLAPSVNDGNGLAMQLRLYDDGLAFRYVVADGNKIEGEATQYKIPETDKRWMQMYDVSYERLFPEQTGTHQRDNHWGYPALVEFDKNVWGLLTEAGIEKCHAASSLKASDFPSVYNVAWGSPASCQETPWRVAIIGSLNEIVESTLVTDVSPESRIEDTSWIEPGAASWIYWAYNHGSKDFQIVKEYIDMAETLKLPYVLIDWEWIEMENGGDIHDAIKYAKDKGIKVLLWYNSSTAWIFGSPLYRLNKPEDREKEYQMLNDWGVSGVKIDFFEGDTQPTMEYCIDLLEDAAKHKLLVNFHGATLPRGWQRTYPNLVSTEGVYGAEWYNNNGYLTDRAASHNTVLPFTRNVVGPMDYTPCTFSDSQHPHITSNAHELALTVLFESTLQHLADKPESYLSQPAEVQEFLSELPTAWDETNLLAGYPGKYVVMARRKGDKWYVAGINGTDAPLTLPLAAQKLGAIKGRLFTDATGPAENGSYVGKPWSITEVSALPSQIDLQPRGGFLFVTTSPAN